jgi:hypothetical protein
MPSISSQPGTTALYAAYGSSLTYSVSQTYTSGDPLPAIEARITVNGSLFSTQFYQPVSTIATTAYFDININGIVQEYFRSINAYPGTFTGYANSASSLNIALVSVQFFSWLANSDGLLELTGSPATSATSKTINSAQSSLSTFSANSNRKFLTNKPNNIVLKASEGELLAVYTTVTSELVIKTYDFSGVLQGTYTKTLSGSGARVCVVGIGYPNLLAMQLTGWTSEVSGGGDMFDSGVSKYYTIQVKQSGGSVFTETRTYYLDNTSDCIAYRIYFLNKLGFYDGISLYDSTFNTFSTDSISFENPITESTPNPRNRLFSKLTNGFTADFLGLTDAEQIWMKELANTVDAYEGTTANPIIVEDVSNAVVKDTYAPENQIVLAFTYSNQQYSQRN